MSIKTWCLIVFSLLIKLPNNSVESVSHKPDPYYINTKYYWSFDGQHEQHKLQYVWGMLEQGIKLSSYVNTSVPWLNLGSVDSSCIPQPFNCDDGFTILFWTRVDGKQTNTVLLNASEQSEARGFHLKISKGKLRLSVTGFEWDNLFPRTVRRFLDTNWNFKTWTHIGLQWNSKMKELKIFFNCSEADYVSSGVSFDRTAHVFAPPQRLIVGADNELSNHGEAEIDELGIWDEILSMEEICHVVHARRVHGVYSPWSEFTPCSVTCGVGVHSRSRTCTNPTPAHGGRNCSHQGSTSEITPCMDKKCPINGGYSEWSKFSICSQTCGGGVSIRIRTCTQPEPKYGGKNCSSLGPAREIRVCNLNPCPVHGGYSAWGNFSVCTKSCENGTKYRNRSCDNPRPLHNGRNCSELGPSFEVVACNEFPCPIHGGYTQWSNFSSCSLTCGGGRKTRVRTCTEPTPQHGGRNCQRFGSANETRRCNTQFCPIDGGYSAWSEFTECTKSCGNGTQLRNRSCDNPTPQYEGKNCSIFGPDVDIKRCNTHPCPIDGGYTLWSDFSSCSLSCGGGSKIRLRSCTNPIPQYGGRDCGHLGPYYEIRRCNTHHCAVHGGYSSWGDFSVCTKTCGNGTKYRTRNCTDPEPAHGGQDCARLGPNLDEVVCNTHPCPVHGNYTAWSEFTSCSATCNHGIQTRTRSCSDPKPMYNGNNCSDLGPEKQTRSCFLRHCPVDGGYGHWTKFSDCSTTCGEDGYQTRTRQCDSPAPRFGGRACARLGAARQIRACNIFPCPIDGGWGEWSEFSGCSKTCESGRRVRIRECDNPPPQYGGRECTVVSGESGVHSVECNPQRCPDIIFTITIKITSEEWKDSFLNFNSLEFQNLEKKILGNVKALYGDNSPLRRMKVLKLWKGSVIALVEIHFFNLLYSGVRELQDEIFLKNKLEELDVIGINIKSIDVPSDPPGNITAYNTSSRSIMVTWNDIPISQSNGNLTNFLVLYAENYTSDYTETIVDPNSYRVELKNLEIFHPYQIRVVARNRRGKGVASLPFIVWTEMEAPNAAPQIQSAYNLTSTSIYIQWFAIPEKNYLGIFLGYIVKYSLGKTDEWMSMTLNTSSLETVIQDLKKFSTYEVTVQGFNRIGRGPASHVHIKTDEDVPSQPPVNIKVENTSSTSVNISWKAIPQQYIHGILRGYGIFYRADHVHVWTNLTVLPDVYSLELTGLRKYQKYYIQVAGLTVKGIGKPCKQIPILTDEDVPSVPPPKVRASNTSSTSLLIEWNPLPKAQTHGILRGYRVYYKRRAFPHWDWITREASPTTRAIEVTGLRKFTKYNIRVAGFTSKGEGKKSELIFVPTAEHVPSRSVNFVTAKALSSTSIKVKWGRIPRGHVHGILRGYKIVYRSIDNNGDIKVEQTIPFTYEKTLENLLKFTTYGIKVIGFTSIGGGKASTEIKCTTLEDLPSKPPLSIKIRSRWSSTEMPVTWKPITPSYYVHGILRGYRIKYKPIRDTLKTINTTFKWDNIGPDKLEYMIKDLQPFTTYVVQVLAYTSVGNGVESEEGYGETCSCQRVFTTNWWQFAPYTTLQDNKAVGIFPDILKHAVAFCCSDCVHGHSANIDFIGSNNTKTKSLQRGFIEMKNNLRDETDFHFPIHGSKFNTTYANGFPYVPLVHSPGAAFIISSHNQFNESEKVFRTVLDSWTFILVLFFLSYLIGLIMWLIERKYNSKYFPMSFFYGPWDGFWWSFITVTTVGYGDKTPRTVVGRFVAMFWTLWGQIMVVMFVAHITSELSSSIIKENIRVYGNKIAVIQNSSEYRLGIKKNAKYDPDVQYSNLKEIYDDLLEHKVFGALIDTYTVSSAKNLFNDAKLTVNNIFDYSLNYGVVLGGEGRKLQPCLEDFLTQETEEIHHSVVKHVKPLKNVLTRNVRIDRTQSLYDATSKTYQHMVIIIAALFAILFLLGVVATYISKYLPHLRLPIDTRTLIARARDRAFESRQTALTNLLTPNNTITRKIKRNFERAKQRHLKEIKCYIKERQKADKRIERALKREEARKEREKARKEREEAKIKRLESEDDAENFSDGNLSSSDSEGSIRRETKNIWEDIEQLEGIFSLV